MATSLAAEAESDSAGEDLMDLTASSGDEHSVAQHLTPRELLNAIYKARLPICVLRPLNTTLLGL